MTRQGGKKRKPREVDQPTQPSAPELSRELRWKYRHAADPNMPAHGTLLPELKRWWAEDGPTLLFDMRQHARATAQLSSNGRVKFGCCEETLDMQTFDWSEIKAAEAWLKKQTPSTWVKVYNEVWPLELYMWVSYSSGEYDWVEKPRWAAVLESKPLPPTRHPDSKSWNYPATHRSWRKALRTETNRICRYQDRNRLDRFSGLTCEQALDEAEETVPEIMADRPFELWQCDADGYRYANSMDTYNHWSYMLTVKPSRRERRKYSRTDPTLCPLGLHKYPLPSKGKSGWCDPRRPFLHGHCPMCGFDLR